MKNDAVLSKYASTFVSFVPLCEKIRKNFPPREKIRKNFPTNCALVRRVIKIIFPISAIYSVLILFYTLERDSCANSSKSPKEIQWIQFPE